MTATFMTGNECGLGDADHGRPRTDQVDSEMVEGQIDEEDDNPDDLDVDEAGFDNEDSDFDVETDRRDEDDNGPDGYTTQFD